MQLKRALRFLLLALAAAASACVPWPHTVIQQPAMSGRVVAAGVPVAGAQLLSAAGTNDEPCAATVALAATAADGSFRIAERRQWRFVYAPLVAPISIAGLRLCIAAEGPPVFADEFLFQPYGESREQTLVCDLAAPRRAAGIGGRERARLCASAGGL